MFTLCALLNALLDFLRNGRGKMKIHEYQAKEILRSYGVPAPKGRVAETPEEARRIAARAVDVRGDWRGSDHRVELLRSVRDV